MVKEDTYRNSPGTDEHLLESSKTEPSQSGAGFVAPTSWWAVILPMAAVILFSIILRSGIASMPLERDEGEYAYIATRWLAGDVPYRDVFDQKTPGVFAAYAALFALGFRSIEAIHWLGHAALVGTVVVLYFLGRRVFSHEVGWIAGLFTVMLAMSANVLGSAANTEVFTILPLTACIYFAIRASESGSVADGVLTGVCGALALSCKQVVVPVVAFAFLWVLYYRGGMRWQGSRGSDRSGTRAQEGTSGSVSQGSRFVLGGALVLGLSLVLVPMVVYFWSQGAWSAFFDCVAGHNLAYGVRVPLRSYGSNFWDATRYIYVVFAPILAAAIYTIYLFRQRGGTAARLCLWWFFTSFLATSVGGYYRNHYLILLVPPLAMIAAYGIEAAAAVLEPGRPSSRRWISAGLAIAALIWPLFVHRSYFWPSSIEYVCRQLYHMNPFPESPAIGKLLRDNSQLDDRIFICGSEPQILFFAERASASRYVFVYPLFATAQSITRQKEVTDELGRRPPKFVLLVDPNIIPTSFSLSPDSPPYFFDAISQLVQREYYPFAVSTLAADGTTRTVRISYNAQSGEPEFTPDPGENVTIQIFRRRKSGEESASEARSESDMQSVRSQLEKNLSEVRGRIEHAARTSGRGTDAVRLVAVTKTVDAPIVSQLVELGVTDVGESRPQELWRKHDLLNSSLRWHLIGPLQKNKARRTVTMTHLIHSVDTSSLLDRLDQLAVELNLNPAVLLEVNVSGEATKHGFRPDGLAGVIEAAADLARVEIRGLMTMAPLSESPERARPFFAALRELCDRLSSNAPPSCQLTELSMGMSHDFEAAIAEGATIVRIGSALFRDIGEQT